MGAPAVGFLKQGVGVGVRGRKHMAVVKGTDYVLPNDGRKWRRLRTKMAAIW